MLVPLLLAACQTPHVCGSSCEAGLVPSSEARAGWSQAPSATEPAPGPARSEGIVLAGGHGAPPQETAPAELGAREALAAFDEAWQTIHDSHFDKRFNGVDWDALRTELRPRAEGARTRAEVREVIGEMLGRLGQSHFALIPSDALPEMAGGESDQSGGLGFDVRLRDGRLLVSSLEPDGAAKAAGVETGWSVTHIGGLEVGDLLERLQAAEDLGPRKVAYTLWAAARARINGRIGARAKVGFLDSTNEPVELQLERRPRDVTVHEVGPTLPTFYLEFRTEMLAHGDKKIGVIAFSNWFLPVMQPLNDAIERMRALDGIIIDLRGNTGGAAAMTMGLAGHFFGEMHKLGVMITRDSTVNIMAIPRRVNAAGELVEPFDGRVAILVDETTGSASEVFAGGMQSLGRARVFGETTAGAVLPAVTTRLPNGDTLLHALGDFETSTGVRLEGAGVVPDAVEPLTRADLLAGRDPVRAAALDWITLTDH